jgi:hypothetical protein
MAKWLNLLTAGPYVYLVYRDAVQVSDLAAVGAEVEVANGVITLTTPNDEHHEWALAVVGQGISYPAPMRMRSFNLISPDGLDEARALCAANGAVIGEIDLTTDQPTTSPDPATFAVPSMAVVLVVDEHEPA